jgi:hypothetical protein
LVFLMLAASACASELSGNRISKILSYKASLNLTESQVEKLETIEQITFNKMNAAMTDAEIRLAKIEKLTSNWANMNSSEVRMLVKGYCNCLAEYKAVEAEAAIKARGILDSEQLNKFQLLTSMESLMLDMEEKFISAR